MPRSGGNYSLPSGNPVVVGTVIDPSWANNTLSDIGTELTNSVPRDGQAPPTANLPMGGFKHTNAALATASTDYARADQAQSGVLAWLTSVSGTNTITASILPTISSYAVGATYRFVSAGANTGAVTLNINGVGAATVSKFGSTALQAGDIQSGAVVTVTYDGTRFQLVTPATETGLHPAGTANGVLYLDGSKVATSGSGLTFDGTNLGVGTASPVARMHAVLAGTELLRLESSTNFGVYARWKRPNREYILALDINNNGGNDFSLYDTTAVATRWTVDASGNLGLGVTPSNWGGASGFLELPNGRALAFAGIGGVVSTNAYYDTSWKYKTTGAAAKYDQAVGTHQWFIAPSGTAGNAITFTQAMTLDASGNLGIGTASPNAPLTFASATGRKVGFFQGTQGYSIGVESSEFRFVTDSSAIFSWRNGSTYSSSTEYMRLDASGNLGIGTASPTRRLEVIGAAAALAMSVQTTGAGQIARFSDGTAQTLIVGTTASGVYYDNANSGIHAWLIGATERMRLDASGNLGLNTSTFGTSAAGVLALGTGTAPTTGPADTVQLFSVDRSAGNTIPAIRCEGSGVTNAGITNTTVTNKIAVQVNGTIYYLLATTNAT